MPAAPAPAPVRAGRPAKRLCDAGVRTEQHAGDLVERLARLRARRARRARPAPSSGGGRPRSRRARAGRRRREQAEAAPRPRVRGRPRPSRLPSTANPAASSSAADEHARPVVVVDDHDRPSLIRHFAFFPGCACRRASPTLVLVRRESAFANSWRRFGRPGIGAAPTALKETNENYWRAFTRKSTSSATAASSSGTSCPTATTPRFRRRCIASRSARGAVGRAAAAPGRAPLGRPPAHHRPRPRRRAPRAPRRVGEAGVQKGGCCGLRAATPGELRTPLLMYGALRTASSIGRDGR